MIASITANLPTTGKIVIQLDPWEAHYLAGYIDALRHHNRDADLLVTDLAQHLRTATPYHPDGGYIHPPDGASA